MEKTGCRKSFFRCIVGVRDVFSFVCWFEIMDSMRKHWKRWETIKSANIVSLLGKKK